MSFFFDEDGFPRNQTMDGMDTALRAGLLATFSFLGRVRMDLRSFEVSPGILCRHPKHFPSNNPRNLSRDNEMVLIAGLSAQGEYKIIRRVFYAHLKRLFFCQNFERDVPGSKKYLWPHVFYKDSRPSAKTMLKRFNFKKWKFEVDLPAVDGGEINEKTADFADILLLDNVWFIIRAGRIWYLYWVAIAGIPFFVLSLFVHARTSHKEHLQLAAISKTHGKWAVKLFKKAIPNWKKEIQEYFDSKNEPEYGRIIINDLETA